MRWVSWCLAGLLLACGKSRADIDERRGASAGASASAGTTSAPETGGSGGAHGGTGGSAGSTASGRGGSGGDAASSGGAGSGSVTAGSSGTAGGANGGAGNASGNGGASVGPTAGGGGAAAGSGTGDAGAAGASEEACGDYLACGCGCCGGASPSHACYYPDLGDTLAGVIAQDEATADSETCANAGCALGTEYHCCVVPSEAGEATYRVDASSTAVDRLTVFRADPEDRCTTLTLSSSLDVPKFPIEVPEGWKVDLAANGFACAEAYNFPSLRHAIGGEGYVAFTTAERCTIDFDVTLFFNLGTEIQATRLVGMSVAVPNLGADCP